MDFRAESLPQFNWLALLLPKGDVRDQDFEVEKA